MKENKWINKLFAVLLVLSAVVGVFRGFVLFKYTNYANGLYTNETTGMVFFAVLLAIFAATAVLYFPLKKNKAQELKKNGAVAKSVSVICAVLLVVLAIMSVMTFVSDGFSLLILSEAVLCVLSAVYFAIIVTGTDKTLTKGIFAMFPAIYTAIHTITIFIDTTTQINSSQRSFTLLALVCLMMYFVTEAGIYIPQGNEKAETEAEKLSAQRKIWAIVSAELVLAVLIPGIVFSAATGDIGTVIYGAAYVFLGIYAVSK